MAVVNSESVREFPEIETERLLLRQLQVEDGPLLHQYWSDVDVLKYMTLDAFQSIGETIEMINLLRSLVENEQGIRWAIVNKDDHAVLGTCGFHNVKSEHRRAEMGYELGKEYWGQGIMREALAAIIGYGFTDKQYNRIEVFINKGNDKSVRIAEKMGFKLDGLLRNYEFARGEFVDQYCYSLLRSDPYVGLEK